MTGSGTWSAALAAGVPGRGEYLNEKAWAKPISRTRASVAREIRVALAGKADDEIGRQRDVGPRRAQALDDAAIVVGGVPPVHRRQHAVGAGLHRQMQERHQLRHVAMRRDQRVVDVARMRGRVAQPREPGDLGERADQLAEPPVAAVRRAAP